MYDRVKSRLNCELKHERGQGSWACVIISGGETNGTINGRKSIQFPIDEVDGTFKASIILEPEKNFIEKIAIVSSTAVDHSVIGVVQKVGGALGKIRETGTTVLSAVTSPQGRAVMKEMVETKMENMAEKMIEKYEGFKAEFAKTEPPKGSSNLQADDERGLITSPKTHLIANGPLLLGDQLPFLIEWIGPGEVEYHISSNNWVCNPEKGKLANKGKVRVWLTLSTIPTSEMKIVIKLTKTSDGSTMNDVCLPIHVHF